MMAAKPGKLKMISSMLFADGSPANAARTSLSRSARTAGSASAKSFTYGRWRGNCRQTSVASGILFKINYLPFLALGGFRPRAEPVKRPGIPSPKGRKHECFHGFCSRQPDARRRRTGVGNRFVATADRADGPGPAQGLGGAPCAVLRESDA